MPPTRAQISVALDGTSGTALDVLISDGTSVGDAVRTAIISAARQPGDRPPSKLAPAPTGGIDARWLSAPQSAAPLRPLAQQPAASARPRRSHAAKESRIPVTADSEAQTSRKRGRPPQHLLSGIATCGVCEAPLRVGAQNLGRHQARNEAARPSRYRVYECAGWPGRPGFHVSMRQEHLDRIVTDAVLARVESPGFDVPLLLRHPGDREERLALLDELQTHRAWLDEVRDAVEGRALGSDALRHQQEIVLPKIAAARHRIAELEKRDPTIAELQFAFPMGPSLWRKLPISRRRHVVEVLVDPIVYPVPRSERGIGGLNERRVQLEWL